MEEQKKKNKRWKRERERKKGERRWPRDKVVLMTATTRSATATRHRHNVCIHPPQEIQQ